MFGEYKKESTWRRIGIVLVVLVALVGLPPMIQMVLDLFTEHDPPRAPAYLDIPGQPRFRLFDRDDDGALADEALRLRREYGLSVGRMLDVDSDDRVDCVTFDGTWRYARGSSCPDRRRQDAEPLTDAERVAADRLLLVEREIRERWLAPLTSSRFDP